MIHKQQVNQELSKIADCLKGEIWLLNNCNHSMHHSSYPHHVRDRISESLVEELQNTIATIDQLKGEIESGIDNEGNWNGVPF